ncbi:hypothetical protein FYJ24_09370 [Actinomycetaceae bacterium WB03_NA08]|uniref:Uncharacterized protein n=1 Tax=Scrofimicrobium canadense TaxID=2652290 RepID=A0A6N7W9Z5_9ACTO|nr:hypothetical protein [Scrofimicrobium canadense]MSS84968.1 hypothetical protein [Scrofimicrobium canadense]
MTRVTAPDLELWLTTYLRTALTSEGHSVQVSNKEPTDLSLPLKQPLIMIRDDSGMRLSHVTFDRSIGVSILAGSRMNDKPANDLGRLVMSILMDDAIVHADGSPIASVDWDGCNGPYPVIDDLDVARRYGTVGYIVVGSW